MTRQTIYWMPALHTTRKIVATSKARFRVLAAGRRWGKSRLGMIECGKVANSRGRAWWIAPTYTVARVGWRGMKQLYGQIPEVAARESERTLSFPRGGSISVRSADDPDSLRGEALDLAVFDEAAYVKKAAWYHSVRPALADRKGRALFISSPNGYDWFWDLYRIGDDPQQPDWASWRFTSYDNPHIDPAEIHDAAREMPERAFRQKFLAEFIEDGSGVFQGVSAASVAQPQTQPVTDHRYCFGVDFVRWNDFTVINVTDATTRTQVWLERFTELNWERQRARLIECAERWRPTAILAEANSIGGPNIELLQGLSLPVIPFTTTGARARAC